NNPSALNTNHIISDKNIQPFSFFHWIIYNPKLHSKPELQAIIAHEEVHVKQLHSLDILLIELFCILQWFNPIVWFYRTTIKQNLEFLADAHNNHIKTNKKEYQYILLNQSITNHQLALVNPFFNSLIKKRIVMINQNPSHKLNALKSLLILPALAIFLMSFNVKKNYIFNYSYTENNSTNRLEFVIDKATTDTELLKMKSDLAKVQYDFSYTTVRNKNGEIENLSIEISGGNKAKGEVSSRYNSASDNDTISPTYIFVDTGINKISIGNGTTETSKKQVTLNGSIVSENQVVNSKKQVVIRSGGKEDADVTIIEEEGGGFLSTDTDNDKEPLFYIDGKKTDSEVIKNLNPNEIKSMNVLKGVSAVEKYGEKAKNGVIEITTKK
ncbi:MAG: M56 family metallopeptidase, partial [Maribacter sp.]